MRCRDHVTQNTRITISRQIGNWFVPLVRFDISNELPITSHTVQRVTWHRILHWSRDTVGLSLKLIILQNLAMETLYLIVWLLSRTESIWELAKLGLKLTLTLIKTNVAVPVYYITLLTRVAAPATWVSDLGIVWCRGVCLYMIMCPCLRTCVRVRVRVCVCVWMFASGTRVATKMYYLPLLHYFTKQKPFSWLGPGEMCSVDRARTESLRRVESWVGGRQRRTRDSRQSSVRKTRRPTRSRNS